MKLHPGSMTGLVLKVCEAPRGASLAEVRQWLGKSTPHYLSTLLSELTGRGELFAAGPHCHKRYFAKAEDRDEWAKVADSEVAAEIAAKKADPAYVERRRAKWREDTRKRDAKRREAAGLPPRPARPPKLSDEERKRRRAEHRSKRYAEERAKLGLTVTPRAERSKPAGSPDIPTTPKKSKQGEAGRGRGIVIGKPKAFTVVTAQDKAKPTTKHSGEPIETPKTIYTRCPPFVDRRYQPDPSIAGRGAITADWEERMRREQSR